MNMEIDARHTLPTIRVPTLVLHRVGDRVYDVAQARYIAERIPNAELVELPGDDHGWWVHPEPIAREVERFLRNIWDSGEWDLVETDRVLATVRHRRLDGEGGGAR
jgi:alpha-beta hydrolase superfamily lysophospholipase